jgi:hypothetical protein
MGKLEIKRDMIEREHICYCLGSAKLGRYLGTAYQVGSVVLRY